MVNCNHHLKNYKMTNPDYRETDSAGVSPNKDRAAFCNVQPRKDAPMTNTPNQTTPATGLLTENELFRLYLDAPVRKGTTSTLIEPEVGGALLEDLGHWDLPEAIQGSHTVDNVVEHIAAGRDVQTDLFDLAQNLSEISQSLFAMQADFRRVAAKLQTPEPGKDAPDSVWDEWERNPRYHDPRQSTAATQ